MLRLFITKLFDQADNVYCAQFNADFVVSITFSGAASIHQDDLMQFYSLLAIYFCQGVELPSIVLVNCLDNVSAYLSLQVLIRLAIGCTRTACLPALALPSL